MHKHTTQSGFTLIELIFTMMIIAIISTTVGPIIFESYENHLVSQRAFEIDWQGYIAAERIINDIHTIRSANDITTAQSTQLSFTNVSGNTIQFQLSGTSLLRNSQILASSVQSLSFTYLDKNGATTGTLSAIRYISISMTLNQNGMTKTISTLGATRGIS